MDDTATRFYDNQCFYEVANRKELYKIFGGKENNPYARIIKVYGGNICFKYMTDYDV